MARTKSETSKSSQTRKTPGNGGASTKSGANGKSDGSAKNRGGANSSKSAKSTTPNGPEADRTGDAPVETLQSRVEEFRKLAQMYATNACVMRPDKYTGHERRLHVRETIIEDHAVRIDHQAQGADEKFDKLAGSLFSFFRGSSLLFHRDIAGDDARMPTVLVLGDVHPENFGVMPNADNVPIFGVNDFDDVIYGPFTWDLKRGATGFLLAVAEEGGMGRKHQLKIARKFIEGYHEGIEYYARHQTESTEQMRADNAPKVIRRLFEKSEKSRESWLRDRYLDETGRGFRANEELTPVSSRLDEFQKLIDDLAKTNGIKEGGRAGTLRVKDVAMRHGQGTASLGLGRYYCLLEGPGEDATDDLIIEFKRARRSALEGLVPANDFDAGDKGDRIAHGQSVHLAAGDVFYGNVDIDGKSFMSRERAPFRNDIDLDDLSKKSWKEYAHSCGIALAQAHARSDDAGQLDYRIEPRIDEAMEPIELFIDDVLSFAEEAVERLARDHAFFVQDWKLGAFDMTLKRYR
ncbi:hypothetical protein OCH239_02240 [Roseivivax halodurans JCM 10272]|uniref:DUF2252 domain-containing protein n=1 Tax=Roseivivax halodurans JCM 10272 TaxID=1449350 RepID=X7EL82_9RHOB|nr:DUF2252 family protein [Roseivivax halodurans]ETX16665.1 hypothetical protein OCH239_02240 [Roseivivax halodurans JCM 10272]